MLENTGASVKGGSRRAGIQCASTSGTNAGGAGRTLAESAAVAKNSHILACLVIAGLLTPFHEAVAATGDPAETTAADPTTTDDPATTPAIDPAAEPIPATAAPIGVTKIQGQAYAGRRQPVVGAAVTVRDEGEAGVLVLTSTDDRGRLRVKDVPDGLYVVTFRKEGYGTVRKDRVGVKSPLRPVIEVPMSASSSAVVADAEPEVPAIEPVLTAVRGRMVDVADAAVPEVRLRLVRTDGRFDPRAVRSGPDGHFVIEDVEAGAWDAEVYGVGFLPIRAPVVVDRALTVTVRLVPQPTDFEASPLDLMPLEIPIAPPGLESAAAAVEPSALR